MNRKLHKKASGIMLDIGCGDHKQPGFVGMDLRKVSGVDIIHDLERFPYPLADDSCLTIVGHHIIEHISPKLTIRMFNELWRIMKVDGQLALSCPYAGSAGFWQDPTHCNGFTERTFQYFDPEFPLYQIYKPKPWKVEKGFPAYQVNGNLEVIMRKKGEKG